MRGGVKLRCQFQKWRVSKSQEANSIHDWKVPSDFCKQFISKWNLQSYTHSSSGTFCMHDNRLWSFDINLKDICLKTYIQKSGTLHWNFFRSNLYFISLYQVFILILFDVTAQILINLPGLLIHRISAEAENCCIHIYYSRISLIQMCNQSIAVGQRMLAWPTWSTTNPAWDTFFNCLNVLSELVLQPIKLLSTKVLSMYYTCLGNLIMLRPTTEAWLGGSRQHPFCPIGSKFYRHDINETKKQLVCPKDKRACHIIPSGVFTQPINKIRCTVYTVHLLTW